MSKSFNESYKNRTLKSRHCINAIKNKHCQWLKYKYCKTIDNFEQYRVARNNATNEVRKSKYNYEKDLALKIKDNNKLFWSYVRNKTKTKKSICKLGKGNAEFTSNEQKTANTLNEYFACVFEFESDLNIPNFEEKPHAQTLRNIEITEDLATGSHKTCNS